MFLSMYRMYRMNIFNTAVTLVCTFYIYSLLVDVSYLVITDCRILFVKVNRMKYMKNSANPEKVAMIFDNCSTVMRPL